MFKNLSFNIKSNHYLLIILLIVAIVLEWFDHKKYERRFKY